MSPSLLCTWNCTTGFSYYEAHFLQNTWTMSLNYALKMTLSPSRWLSICLFLLHFHQAHRGVTRYLLAGPFLSCIQKSERRGECQCFQESRTSGNYKPDAVTMQIITTIELLVLTACLAQWHYYQASCHRPVSRNKRLIVFCSENMLDEADGSCRWWVSEGPVVLHCCSKHLHNQVLQWSLGEVKYIFTQISENYGWKYCTAILKILLDC